MMKKEQNIYLSCKILLVAIIFAALPMIANAAAGKVEFTSGEVTVQSADGGSKILVKGTEINTGDTILTGSGSVQIKFTDGGYMSFQPGTEFKVENYNFNGKQDGTEKSFFKLVKGGLRAISGLVGHKNRAAYRVTTPVASIGIRGTHYVADFSDKLTVRCVQGSVYVFNGQGDITLFAGQTAVAEINGAPRYKDKMPSLELGGPPGSDPASVNEQKIIEEENNNIYKESFPGDSTGKPSVLDDGM